MKTKQTIVHSCRKHASARIATVLSVLLLAVLLTLSSCTGGDGGEGGGLGGIIGDGGGIGGIFGNNGQEPVYTGMTISDTAGTASAGLPGFDMLSLRTSDPGLQAPAEQSTANGSTQDPNPDKGNDHHGKVEGDLPGKQPDQDNPFGDAEEGSNNSDILLDKAESSLQIQGAAKPIYYATANQDIYITIHVDNPDSFEILSFTLNGEKYSSYMFEPGSDMENLILKVNVGAAQGVVEYTIDAIKYVDGTEIKDVRMDGDKTVRAGVWTDQQPVPMVSNEVINFNDISFDVSVDDALSLISFSEGTVMAVIYNGDAIVDMKPITMGEQNRISFTGLKTNALYQYAILAYYDALDGTGPNVYVLQTKAFYTRAILLFDSVSLGSESIDYQFIWADDAPDKTVTSLVLEHATEGSSAMDPGATSISGLLSANEYTLTASYPNGSNTESVSITFTTQAKQVPTATLNEVSVSQTELGFALSLNDPDGVATLTRLELTCDKTGTTRLPLDTTVASGLLSNTSYTLTATYTYDLNDGNGAHELVTELHMRTQAKTAPKASMRQTAIGQDSLGFDLSVNDPDGIATLSRLELICNKTGTVELPLDATTASGLLSNTNYKVRATYVYDLNDGTGVHETTAELSFVTLRKTTPGLTLTAGAVGQEDFAFDLAITDPDLIATLTRLELICDKAATIELPLDARSVGNLLSDTTYTLRATFSYDLNDGTGVQEKYTDLIIYTLNKATPSLTLTAGEVGQEELSFDLQIRDPDALATLTRIELLSNKGTPVQLALNATGATGLLSDTQYTIRAWFVYDLNDGNGTHEEYVDLTVKTLAKAAPTLILNSDDIGQEELSFDLQINDPDALATLTRIELLSNKGTPVQLALNATGATGLLSDTQYTIRAWYTFDLNDGVGMRTEHVDLVIKTLAKSVPTFTINDADKTHSFITVTTESNDPDNVGTITDLSIYLKDELLASSTTFNQATFENLLSNTTYTVVLSYEYDLNDGTGVHQGTVSLDVLTKVYFVPVSVVGGNTAAVSEGEYVYIDVNVVNPNGATVNSVRINGIDYPASSTSTNDVVRVEIKHENQFNGGWTDFVVESLTATANGETHVYPLTENNVATLFINGKLLVNSFAIVDETGVPVEYAFPSETPLFYVMLSNDTGYAIDSIVIRQHYNWWYNDYTYYANQMIVLSNEVVMIPIANRSGGYYDFEIVSITYSSATLTEPKNITVQTAKQSLLCFETDEIIEVSTPEDLKNMNRWAYYQLTDNIDLSQSGSWIPTNSFNGYLDGNGYAIKNMTVRESFQDKNINIGLFTYASGKIVDLTLSNVLVQSTLTVTDTTWYSINYGAIAPNTNDYRLVLDNVTVDQMVEINTSGNNASYSVGVLLPYHSGNLYLNDVIIKGSVTVNGSTLSNDESLGSDASLLPKPPVMEGSNAPDAQRVTVSFDTGCSTVLDPIKVLFLSNLPTLTNDGYMFCGWYDNADFAGKPYKAGDRPAGNITLYAKWEYIGISESKGLEIKDGVVVGIGDCTDTVLYINMPIANYAFQNCSQITTVYLGANVTSIGYYAFQYCYGLTTVVLPETLTRIENGTFYYCYNLKSIRIPENVTSIGSYAFYSCHALSEVTLPTSLTTIESYTFAYCHALSSITLPDSLTTIGDGAFEHCGNLRNVTLPGSLTQIYSYAFYGTPLQLTVIPKSVTYVGYYAFSSGKVCVSQDKRPSDWDENWYEPNSTRVLWGAKELYTDEQGVVYMLLSDQTAIVIGYTGDAKRITISGIDGYAVTEISAYAFSGCNYLESVIISADITKIDEYAFNGCMALQEVVLPETLTKIGQHAFNGISNNAVIHIPDATETIGEYAFSCKVYYSGEQAPEGWDANWNTNADNVTWNVADYLTDSYGVTYVLFNDGTATILGVNGTVSEIVLGGVEGFPVTEIPAYLFNGTMGITKVTIHPDITTIGEYAFYSLSVDHFIIPSSVTTVGKYAFSNQKIFIEHDSKPEGWTKTWYDGNANNVFWSFDKFHTDENGAVYALTTTGIAYLIQYPLTSSEVVINGLNGYDTILLFNFSSISNLTKVTLLDGVVGIGDYAFSGCYSLVEINLPSTLTVIGEYAFQGCNALKTVVLPSGLETVKNRAFYGANCHVLIPDTVTTIGEYAFYGCYVYAQASEKPTGWDNSWNGWNSYVVWKTPTGTFYTNDKGVIYLLDNNKQAHLYFYDTSTAELIFEGVAGYGVVVHRDPRGFYHAVEKLILGEGIVEIDSYAFECCHSLKEVSLPSTLTKICSYAFYGTSPGSVYITIPESVTTIGENAFSNVLILTSLTSKPKNWHDNWNSGYSNNVCWDFKEFYTDANGISYMLTNGGLAYVCDYPANATELIIGGLDGYSVILSKNFSGNSNLKKVTLLEGVIAIGSNVFQNCYNLKEVILPATLTEIGSHAFSGCTGLSTLTLPEGLKTIGSYAFNSSYCHVYIPASVEVIGECAFYGAYPYAATTARPEGWHYAWLGWNSQTNYAWSVPAGSFYTNANGITYLLIDDGTAHLYYYNTDVTELTLEGVEGYSVIVYDVYDIGNSTVEKLIIGEGVIKIGQYAFQDWKQLTSVTLPSTLVEIEQYAFYNAKIVDLIIPATVAKIGYAAFNTNEIINVQINNQPIGWNANWYTGDSKNVYWNISGFYEDEENGITYALHPDGTASIYSFNGEAEDVVIVAPDGYIVTDIYNGVFRDTQIVSISLPGTITQIGNHAFYNCYYLEQVTLSEGLKTIGAYAFYGCTSLEQINLPDTLTTIGSYAFYNCYSLLNVTLPEGLTAINDHAFYNCDSLTAITIPGSVTTIGNYAFYDCAALMTVVIGNGVTAIGDSAFRDCYAMTSLTLPDTLITIGNNAFDYCYSLTQLVLPDSVTTIGDYAFYHCYNIQQITWSNSLTTIGSYAFYYNNCLTQIILPESLQTIGAYAFQACYSLRTALIPASVTTVGEYAFTNGYVYACASKKPTDWHNNWNGEASDRKDYVAWGFEKFYTDSYGVTYALFSNGTAKLMSYDTNLTEIVLGVDGYTLKEIPSSFFYNNDNLISIVIPEGVTKIGESAFAECNYLTTVTLPSTLVEMQNNAFYWCVSLTNVKLPENLTKIGSNAFYCCRALTNITLPNSLIEIGGYAFYEVSLQLTYIPASVTTIGEYAFNNGGMYYASAAEAPSGWSSAWCGYHDVTWNVKAIATDEQGVVYMLRNDMTAVVIGYNGTANRLVIGGIDGYTVTEIGKHAFSCNGSLEFVVIPESVTKIGEYAFYDCPALRDVTLPDTLVEIGSHAFYSVNSSSINVIRIPDSVTIIGEYAFNSKTYYSGAQAPEGWADNWCTASTIWNVATYHVDSYGVTYILFNDNTAIIAGVNGAVSEIVLGGVEGFPVTEIPAHLLSGRNDITKVIIDPSITAIGEYAFYNATCAVILPAGVETIGYYAFGNCTVFAIGSQAQVGWDTAWCGENDEKLHTVFWNFAELYSDENGFHYALCNDGIAYLYKYTGNATEITIGGLTVDEQTYDVVIRGAFQENTNIRKVTLLDGVIAVDTYAFRNCTGLAELTLPNTLEKIGYDAFFTCSSLTNVVLPASLKEVASHAFCHTNCYIFVPGTISEIGYNAFYSCKVFTTASTAGANWEGNWYGWSSENIVWNAPAGTFYTNENGTTYLISDGIAHLYLFDIYTSTLTIEGVEGYDVIVHNRGNRNSNSYVEKVIISEGVTKIDAYAFYCWYSLSGITLPSTLVEIGEYAFYEAPIQNLSIPATITTIGYYAFTTNNRINVHFNTKPSSWSDGWYSGDGKNVYWNISGFYEDEANGITYALHPDGTASVYSFNGEATEIVLVAPEGYTITDIYAGVFRNSAIVSITIPDTVTYIGTGAFSDCNYLEQVILPNGLTEIGSNAFYYCTALEQIELPESLLVIGDYAFYYCYSLSSITFPEGLTKIGAHAFRDCDSLTTVTFPASVTFLGEYAFYDCDRLTAVTIPGSITTIQSSTFAECNNLQTVIIGDGVTTIGEYAFEYCYAMTNLTLPNTLCTIGAYAFNHCYSLTQLVLPDSVTTIGDCAFYYCYGFQQITWSKSLTSIGRNAFYYNHNLTQIILPEGLKTIGAYAFQSCYGLRTVVIPASVTTIGEYAFSYGAIYATAGKKPTDWHKNWNGDSIDRIDATIWGFEKFYTDSYGVTYALFANGIASLVSYDTNRTEIVLGVDGYTLKEIPSSFFYNNDNLISIVIPEGVTKIGDSAFEECSYLTTVTLPSTLVEIQNNAFDWCNRLTSAELPENLTKIGAYAFYYCQAITDLTLPNSLIEIGSYAFQGVPLQLTYIPASVTTIGDYAFNTGGKYYAGAADEPEGWSSAWCGYSDMGRDVTWNVKAIVTDEQGVVYMLRNDMTAVVIGYNGNATSLVIGGIDGYTVTEIGANAFLNCSLTSIVIPEGVTKIGANAFSGSMSLREVILPNTLLEIGEYAFNSTMYDSITRIPDSVTTIGAYAFSCRTYYSGAQAPEGWHTNWSNNADGMIWNVVDAYTDKYGVTYAKFSDGTYAIIGVNGTVSDIVLGGVEDFPVTEIPSNLLGAQMTLNKVTIASGITTIRSYAIQYVGQVIIPTSVTTIEADAFSFYANIFVEASEKPEGWDDNWYGDYENDVIWGFIEIYTDDNGVTYALTESDIAYVIGLPTDVTELTIGLDGYDVIIGNSIRAGYSLEKLVLLDGVICIGDGVFSYCTNLKEIVLPSTLQEIGDSAFQNCTALTQLALPNSLKTIGNSAFYGCNGLTYVVLPQGLETIGEYAFQNTYIHVLIPDSVTQIGYCAFNSCNVFAAAAERLDTWNYNWNGWNGNVTWRVPYGEFYTAGNGALYILSDSVAYLVKYETEATEIVIGGLTIDEQAYDVVIHGAFQENTYLKKVTLLDGVIAVGYNAFRNCTNLAEVIFPSTLEAIGYDAFYNCYGLISIMLPESLQVVDSHAFCHANCHVYLPATVVEIGYNAFYGCYIYTPASSRAETWDESWNGGYSQNIVWNAPEGVLYTNASGMTYLLSDGIAHLYFFDTYNSTLTIEGVEGYDVIIHSNENRHYSSSVNKVIIGEGVTKIDAYAFYCWYNLSSVTLPSTLVEIGEYAFYNAPITDLSIPAGTTKIGSAAFSTEHIINVHVNKKPAGWAANWYTGDSKNVYWNISGFYEDQENGITYALHPDGTASVYSFNGEITEVVLVAPEGYTITDIYANAFRNSSITSIELPDTLLYIEQSAFYNCTELAQITLPASLITIGTEAFYNCYTLSNVTFPEGLTIIGDFAFYNCDSLTEISIPGSVTTIGSSAFYNCDALETVVIGEGVAVIGNSAFYNCDALTSVTLPESLTSLGSYAFYGCEKLTTITIPGGIQEIQSYAFAHCTRLQTVVIGNGITKIGPYAFTYCKSLVNLTLSNTLTTIEEHAFDQCYNLTQLVLPDSVTTICDSAFYYCYGIQQITWSSSLTSIGKQAFFYNNSLTQIILPEGLKTISAYAFQSCSSLQAVVIPSTVTSIGEAAFSYGYIFACHANKPSGWHANWNNGSDRKDYILWNFEEFYTDSYGVVYALFSDGTASIYSFLDEVENVIIEAPEGYTVTNIHPRAFCESDIVSIVLPEGLTRIGVAAFQNCYYLKQVTLPGTLTHIGAQAFYNCTDLAAIDLPGSLIEIGDRAFGNCDSLTEVTIPGRVSTIGTYAFQECNYLESVVLSEGVTQVGAGMFYNCYNLKYVTLPSTLTVIAEYSFYNCRNMNQFDLPEFLTKIGSYAFYNCEKLHTITLPDSMVEIGQNAFYSADLTSVFIPGTVSSIGYHAFPEGYAYIALEKIPTGWDNDWNGNRVDRKAYALWNFDRLYTDEYGVTYALFTNGTARLYQYDGSVSEIVIGIQNYTITEIPASFFRNNDAITSVVIAEGITKIGSYAFYGCQNLTSITLPDSLLEVGERAFSAGNRSAIIYIPANVTTIGYYAFESNHLFCGAEKALENWATSWCGSYSSYVTWNVDEVYTDSYGVTYVRFNDGSATIAYVDGSVSEIVLGGADGFDVTEIPAYLLQNRSNITKITLHEDIQSIGEYALQLQNLQYIIIPKTVTSIDAYAISAQYVFVEHASASDLTLDESWNVGGNLNVYWDFKELYEDANGVCYALTNSGIAYAYDYPTDTTEVIIGDLDLEEEYSVVLIKTTYNNNTIEKVTLMDGVVSIGANAFYSCYNLCELILPDTLEEIGAYAFYNCDNLVSLVLPANLTTVGTYAFGDSGIHVLIPASVTTIDYAAFDRCYAYVTIPSNQVPEGWSSQWKGWSGYTFWNAPVGTFEFDEHGAIYLCAGEYAHVYFYNASTEEVVINGFGDYEVIVHAFYSYNSTVKKLIIGEGVVKIDANAFDHWQSLEEISLPSTLKEIGEYAFNNAGVSNICIVIPASVEKIGAYAFNRGILLSSFTEKPADWNANWFGGTQRNLYWNFKEIVEVNDGIYVVTNDDIAYLAAYYGDWTDVTIGGVEGYDVVVHDNFFEQKSSIKTVTLLDGVTKIGAYAFHNCSNLNTLNMSNTLKEIGKHAFWSTALNEPTIPASVQKIGYRAFSALTIYTMVNTKPADWDENWCLSNATVYWNLFELVVDKQNGVTYILHNDNTASVYSFDGSVTSVTLMATIEHGGKSYTVTDIYPGVFANTSITSITLPEGMIEIGINAFNNCDALTQVTLPSTLITIDNYAFQDCDALTQITLPGKVTKLGNYAFAYCDKLASVTLPDSLTVIGNYAFYQCQQLDDVTLSASLTEIGNHAFYNCVKLNDLTLPDSITSIGNYAFYNCYNLELNALPASLTQLGYCAMSSVKFSNYTVIPAGLITMGNNALSGYFTASAAQKPDGWDDNWNSYSSWTIWNVQTVIYDEANGMTYALRNDNTAVLISFDDSVDTFEIGVDNYTVTEIAPYAFQKCTEIVNLVLPEGIVKIGSYAFVNCDYLKQITLPSTLLTIDSYAFNNCDALTSITIPEGVVTIGQAAFSHCYALQSVVISDSVSSIGEQAFYHCNALQSVEIGCGVSTIAPYTFYYCYNLVNVTLPESLTVIGNSAFYYCSALKSITIPEGVVEIGNQAFGECYQLKSISLPSTLEKIGSYAFSGCHNLNAVVIPENVTKIEQYAFNYGVIYVYTDKKPDGWNKNWNGEGRKDSVCYNFQEFYTDGQGVIYALFQNQTAIVIGYTGEITEILIKLDGYTVTSIAPNAFHNCDTLQSVVISHGTTKIGAHAFDDCDSLTSITLPSTVTIIGDYAFSGCEALEKAVIPSGVVEIGAYAFSHCYVLRELLLPVTLQEIGEGAFQCCYALEKVTVPNGVVKIGDWAFTYCSKLREVSLPTTLTEIGTSAFYGTALKNTVIPSSVTSIGSNAFNSGLLYLYSQTVPETWNESWNTDRDLYTICNFEKFYVDEQYVVYALRNDKTALVVDYYGNTTDLVLAVEGYTITEIAYRAFYNNEAVETIVIPNTVTVIGYEAFAECRYLKSITMSTNLTYVAERAFYNCQNLTSVALPASTTAIGPYAFYNCYNLMTIAWSEGLAEIGERAFYNCYNLGDLTFPSTLTKIGSYAFYNCDSLLYLVIPGVETIESYAFSQCNNLVTVIFSAGTKTIGSGAFHQCYNLKQITLPSTLTEIGTYAFYNCNRLAAVTIPEGTLCIDDSAFAHCSNLAQVTLPITLIEIGNYAFQYCYALTSVTIPQSVSTVGQYAFSHGTIYLFTEKVPIGWHAKWNSDDRKDYVVFGFSSFFTDEQGIRYALNSDGTAVVVGFSGDVTDVVIGLENYTVTSIAYRAFYDCKTLTSIVIPEGVTIICEEAFYNCEALESVSLPGTLVEIGNFAFYSCRGLTELTLPANLTKVGAHAFYHCNNLESVIIPASVITVGDVAFALYNYGTIYVTASERPDGWNTNWVFTYGNVVWGYVPEA